MSGCVWSEHQDVFRWYDYVDRAENHWSRAAVGKCFLERPRESVLCGPCALCRNYWTLWLKHKSSHRQCEWAWLCSNETLFTKTEGGPQFADSWCRLLKLIIDYIKTMLTIFRSTSSPGLPNSYCCPFSSWEVFPPSVLPYLSWLAATHFSRPSLDFAASRMCCWTYQCSHHVLM